MPKWKSWYIHFYVGSMWDDSRLRAARSYAYSPDSPFSVGSSFTRSALLLFGLPLLNNYGVDVGRTPPLPTVPSLSDRLSRGPPTSSVFLSFRFLEYVTISRMQEVSRLCTCVTCDVHVWRVTYMRDVLAAVVLRCCCTSGPRRPSASCGPATPSTCPSTPPTSCRRRRRRRRSTPSWASTTARRSTGASSARTAGEQTEPGSSSAHTRRWANWANWASTTARRSTGASLARTAGEPTEPERVQLTSEVS